MYFSTSTESPSLSSRLITNCDGAQDGNHGQSNRGGKGMTDNQWPGNVPWNPASGFMPRAAFHLLRTRAVQTKAPPTAAAGSLHSRRKACTSSDWFAPPVMVVFSWSRAGGECSAAVCAAAQSASGP